ncbi:MAG: gamma-glutamylcyclotransferase family protein [Methylovirgula sp.]
MPLYFAYGSNMDRQAMRLRCPGSRPLGLARLARHRFFIMGSGYASVKCDPRTDVHGVLYELALSDVPALDRYEDIGRGLYRKVMQPVLRAAGAPVRALVYIGSSAVEGTPAPAYLNAILAAARDWLLPAAYLSYLASFGESAAPQAPRRAVQGKGI